MKRTTLIILVVLCFLFLFSCKSENKESDSAPTKNTTSISKNTLPKKSEKSNNVTLKVNLDYIEGYNNEISWDKIKLTISKDGNDLTYLYKKDENIQLNNIGASGEYKITVELIDTQSSTKDGNYRVIAFGSEQQLINLGENNLQIPLQYKNGNLAIKTSIQSQFDVSTINGTITSSTQGKKRITFEPDPAGYIVELYPSVWTAEFEILDKNNKVLKKILPVSMEIKPSETATTEINIQDIKTSFSVELPFISMVEGLKYDFEGEKVILYWNYNDKFDKFRVYKQESDNSYLKYLGETKEMMFEDVNFTENSEYGINVIYGKKESGLRKIVLLPSTSEQKPKEIKTSLSATTKELAETKESTQTKEIITILPLKKIETKETVKKQPEKQNINKEKEKTKSFVLKEWMRLYGGSMNDWAYSMIRDGENYVVVGASQSKDKDYTDNKGKTDAFIMKTDKNGKIIFIKTYGGTGIDEFVSIIKDGEDYVVAGNSNSQNGDFIGNKGSFDVNLFKFDKNGNIKWKRDFGGKGEDTASKVIKVITGGYLIGANTFSIDGDIKKKNGKNDTSDIWLIRVSEQGTKLWERTYGGNNNDELKDLIEIKDGNFILAGYTQSKDNGIEKNYGKADGLAMKITIEGEVSWIRTYGGSENESLKNVIETNDGGLIFGGRTSSKNGILKRNYGGSDAWLIKTDFTGKTEWINNYGSTQNDEFIKIFRNVDGYIAVGSSRSYNSERENLGQNDIYILYLNKFGSEISRKLLGGTKEDIIQDVIFDKQLIILGYTYSEDGNFDQNKGLADNFIVKLN